MGHCLLPTHPFSCRDEMDLGAKTLTHYPNPKGPTHPPPSLDPLCWNIVPRVCSEDGQPVFVTEQGHRDTNVFIMRFVRGSEQGSRGGPARITELSPLMLGLQLLTIAPRCRSNRSKARFWVT
jgi:hypothetical protein